MFFEKGAFARENKEIAEVITQEPEMISPPNVSHSSGTECFEQHQKEYKTRFPVQSNLSNTDRFLFTYKILIHFL